MADLKTVLTETLRQHGELEDSGGTCECGWYVRGSDHAEHVAGVLLGLSGVAVTQLPEPYTREYPTGFSADDYGLTVHGGRVWDGDEGCPGHLPSGARSIAAIWAAAANEAESAAAAGVFSQGATND